jgi:hypothetical protein
MLVTFFLHSQNKQTLHGLKMGIFQFLIINSDLGVQIKNPRRKAIENETFEILNL